MKDNVNETDDAVHAGIAAALAAAQAEMGKALKQSNNPAFRTKYADLGNVMDACLPALNRHGIAVVQPTGALEGERFVETILLHTSGEKLACRVPLIVGKNDMQGYGSAVTYARRYGLMCMAGIAPEDDDGVAAKAPPAERPASRPQPPAHRPDPSRDGPAPADHAIAALMAADSEEALTEIYKGLPAGIRSLPEVIGAGANRKAELRNPAPADDLAGDEIPY
jgi:hypothetical protein